MSKAEMATCSTADDEPQCDADFTPMRWSMKEIRAAIPAHLFERDTLRGCRFLLRDLVLASLLWTLASYIDVVFYPVDAQRHAEVSRAGFEVARWLAWATYWWFQGFVFTGIWVIGHECGHGAFSTSRTLCNTIGYITHTLLLTPYFSWRISHHRHHSNHASMEKDEVYVPKTRKDLTIPEDHGQHIDYEEYFGDTPIYTLFMLVRQQLLAFPAYLLFNVSGQKGYPKLTNHFDPNSVLFNKRQRAAVIYSNLGMAAMVWALVFASRRYGFAAVAKFYGMPWLAVTHWFIMITYLHHTDPRVPHYRSKEWNYQRGAAATVDRDFLGWHGRFFLHDVAHYHVIHHFFPKLPFYHAAEATQYLRAFIGAHYMSSDAPVFRELWRNYQLCQFVEDEGDILFYKDAKGRPHRRAA